MLKFPPDFGTFMEQGSLYTFTINVLSCYPIYIGGCFKNITKKPVFRHLYKMGRLPINISVLVSSTQDGRFVEGMRFFSIRRVSEDTGTSLRAVRNAYHSKRTSIRKASGEVYTLEWERPVAPIDTRECYHCHKALTVKDRSTWFHMERKDIKEAPVTFTSLYVASDQSSDILQHSQNRPTGDRWLKF